MDSFSTGSPVLSANQQSDSLANHGSTSPVNHPSDGIQNSPMETQANDLPTRLFVSDEQRLVKQRFEEKQRNEARRAALAEKQAKKKVII